MKQEKMLALFEVANVDVLKCWKIENQYWPSGFVKERLNSPWWLVKTKKGMITIGWRKRVISIEWEDTGIEKVLTEDEVTKCETYVHAWSMVKAAEYLTELGDEIRKEE